MANLRTRDRKAALAEAKLKKTVKPRTINRLKRSRKATERERGMATDDRRDLFKARLANVRSGRDRKKPTTKGK